MLLAVRDVYALRLDIDAGSVVRSRVYVAKCRKTSRANLLTLHALGMSALWRTRSRTLTVSIFVRVTACVHMDLGRAMKG